MRGKGFRFQLRTGFGLVANHSLVMASYLSRANAAIIDLRDLLAQG